MRETDVAWAAGLFEGEGCISIYAEDRPRLSMAMTDRDVMERFQSIVGGLLNGPLPRRMSRNGTLCQALWEWRLSGIDDVTRCLDAFLPYLGARRRARAADVIAQYHESGVKRRPARGNRRTSHCYL